MNSRTKRLVVKLSVVAMLLCIFGGGTERKQIAQSLTGDDRETRKAALVPTVLTPGDIAIVGRITNGSPDSFSFVNLVPLGSGTIVYFTDNGWTGAGFRGVTAGSGAGNEGIYRFTANSDIPAGTLIRSIDASPNFTWTTSGAIGAGGNYSVPSFGNGSGEQITAVQSTNPTNPLFTGFTTVYQLDNTKSFENAVDSGSGGLAPAMTFQQDAVAQGNLASYAAFNLTSMPSGSKSDWLAAISNPANWTFGALASLPTTNITVGAGPTAPSIRETSVHPRFNLPEAAGGYLSAVVGDADDGGQLLGVSFTLADPDTPVNSLTVTANSSNPAVVPNASLNLTGVGATRNLKITPIAAGYSTITVSVNDGTTTANYVISYAASVPSNNTATTVWHTGKADASTAIAIDSNYMFVADDEDQFIRLYDRDNSSLPLNSFNFNDSLGLTDINNGDLREVDIEASAQVGNRIYWLASQSNSSTGANRPNRSRLFATDVSGTGAASTLAYAGRYDNLKDDLIAWDVANGHGLGANFLGLAASAAPPKIPETQDGSGWNIEGLVFAPDNSTAYIGFRAPISPASARTKGLLVPVTNIALLIGGVGPAVFGPPIQLTLGGRGIREIKKNSSNEYLIIGGTAGGPAAFAMFSWTGNPADAVLYRATTLTGLNPECIVEVPVGLNAFAPVNVQLISDNGDDIYYGDAIAAKDLPSNDLKKFRSDIVNVGLSATAAAVRVEGRAIAADGRGVGRARVFLTNAETGEIFMTVTSSLGYFRFDGVPVGVSYALSVSAKGFAFPSQVISPVDEISGLEVVAEPN